MRARKVEITNLQCSSKEQSLTSMIMSHAILLLLCWNHESTCLPYQSLVSIYDNYHIAWKCSLAKHVVSYATVQLRCNFTFAHEQFTCTSSNLLALVWSYLWRVLYNQRGTHTRLLDDLQQWFLTRLHMLVSRIVSWMTITSTG